MRRRIAIFLVLIMAIAFLGMGNSACDNTGNEQDATKNLQVGSVLALAQPIPTDITYSLERYNLIRRMYWVNGQREKANMLPCPIADVPLGYIVCFTDSGAVVGRFVVEGKVSALTNFLTPISEYYEGSGSSSWKNQWIPDSDGTYGDNPIGVFWFTPDKKYCEWSGLYLYSDTLFEVADPILKVGN